jgi:hypothetical protein
MQGKNKEKKDFAYLKSVRSVILTINGNNRTCVYCERGSQELS